MGSVDATALAERVTGDVITTPPNGNVYVNHTIVGVQPFGAGVVREPDRGRGHTSFFFACERPITQDSR
jgi:hypothetical protein